MWTPPLVLVLIVLVSGTASGLDRKCGECRPDACEPPAEECLAGLVKDLCGCCYVCGRREGEVCDSDALPAPYRGRGGPCGEHLECRARTDLAPGDPPQAQCVCSKTEVLCGSDGRTYENECQLTESRYMQRDTGIRATHRGPCRSAPKIVSPPEETSNYTGGNIAMSCEATGWPIPVFEWRVDIGDGNTVPLPSDDPKVSVQTRGGPSKYEVTSWLQLISIQPKDEATYWCIAKNEEGESSAAARVVVLDFKGSQLSDKGRSNDL